ncbi:hypothetical protein MKZ38_005143 [Zalerion maritima]|uniref:Uncharacterized protein n=1 Tax=Zalerion maritima TaxID=339359 RepID=A0AAD5RRB6_9PEZI|nr:hypothetical protein MKZ38_005143 [Zalerion maritima]
MIPRQVKDPSYLPSKYLQPPPTFDSAHLVLIWFVPWIRILEAPGMFCFLGLDVWTTRQVNVSFAIPAHPSPMHQNPHPKRSSSIGAHQQATIFCNHASTRLMITPSSDFFAPFGSDRLVLERRVFAATALACWYELWMNLLVEHRLGWSFWNAASWLDAHIQPHIHISPAHVSGFGWRDWMNIGS